MAARAAPIDMRLEDCAPRRWKLASEEGEEIVVVETRIHGSCRLARMLSRAMIAASGRAADALRSHPELERIAEALVERGRSAWPKIEGVNPEAFVTHVARTLDGAESPAEILDQLHAGDMWLAYAAGSGDRRAIAELDRQIGPVTKAALAKMGGKVAAEDVGQILREKLLVPRSDGGPPKILEYSGRGPLGAWIRIAAIRAALNLLRGGDAAAVEPVTRETLLAAPAVAPDPELDHFRKRYATEFKESFEDALAALSPAERNLLRLSLVDGLSIDEIGVVFGIHRATAARRLASAREEVQRGTRKRLQDRLDVAPAELRSIMAHIQSHVELSLQRVLGEGELPAAPQAKAARGASNAKRHRPRATNQRR